MSNGDWVDHERRLRNAVDQIAQVQEFDLYDASTALEDLIADADSVAEHARALQEACRRQGVSSIRELLRRSG